MMTAHGQETARALRVIARSLSIVDLVILPLYGVTLAVAAAARLFGTPYVTI